MDIFPFARNRFRQNDGHPPSAHSEQAPGTTLASQVNAGQQRDPELGGVA
jgi:hypothetical protein